MRHFSTTKRLKQFALHQHMRNVGQGKRLETLNKIEEGMNTLNTDVTKPYGKKEPDLLRPMQHPKKLDSADTNIVSYRVPPKNLTPYEHVPDQALVQMTEVCRDSPSGARSHQLTLLGAPNAGKSSLLNQLVSKHISATSPKAGTTDSASFGVFTDLNSRTQLLIYDTPGFTKASNSLKSNLLVTKAWDTL